MTDTNFPSQPTSKAPKNVVDVTDAGARLDAAATMLEDWAKRRGVLDDPYVTGLLEAMRTQHNLTVWAAQNPFDLLPRPADEELATTAQDTLTNIRNVLVFVPVAITWWGVYEATTAFEAIRTTSDGVDVTFLDVWLTGGGDPGALWTISRIALADFGLAAIIVLLTMIATLLQRHRARIAAESGHTMEAERTQVALDLLAALHGRKESTPDSIAETIAEVLGDLTSAGRQVLDASTRLGDASTKASGELNAAAGRLEQSTRSAVKDLAETIDSFRTSSSGIEDLTTKLETLEQRLDALLTAGASSIQQPLQDAQVAAKQLQQTVSELTSWAKSDPHGRVEHFVESLDRVGEKLNGVATQVEFGTMQLREDLEALSSHIGGMSTARENW